MAVSVLVPVLLKTTPQVPVPLASRLIVQLVSAPVIVTVPVGMLAPPDTVTETATVAPGVEGLGICEVIMVLFDANT